METCIHLHTTAIDLSTSVTGLSDVNAPDSRRKTVHLANMLLLCFGQSAVNTLCNLPHWSHNVTVACVAVIIPLTKCVTSLVKVIRNALL